LTATVSVNESPAVMIGAEALTLTSFEIGHALARADAGTMAITRSAARATNHRYRVTCLVPPSTPVRRTSGI